MRKLSGRTRKRSPGHVHVIEQRLPESQEGAWDLNGRDRGKSYNQPAKEPRIAGLQVLKILPTLFLLTLATLTACSAPTPVPETLAPATTPMPTESPTASDRPTQRPAAVATATPSSPPGPEPAPTPASVPQTTNVPTPPPTEPAKAPRVPAHAKGDRTPADGRPRKCRP